MKGFTLLEVMVALLIASCGLIGIAGMQLSALQGSQEAYYQSLATTQLVSLFERLRANPASPARSRELARWNALNARLLPHGTGDINCQASLCTAHLHWLLKQPQTLSMSTQLMLK